MLLLRCLGIGTLFLFNGSFSLHAQKVLTADSMRIASKSAEHFYSIIKTKLDSCGQVNSALKRENDLLKLLLAKYKSDSSSLQGQVKNAKDTLTTRINLLEENIYKMIRTISDLTLQI